MERLTFKDYKKFLVSIGKEPTNFFKYDETSTVEHPNGILRVQPLTAKPDLVKGEFRVYYRQGSEIECICIEGTGCTICKVGMVPNDTKPYLYYEGEEFSNKFDEFLKKNYLEVYNSHRTTLIQNRIKLYQERANSKQAELDDINRQIKFLELQLLDYK